MKVFQTYLLKMMANLQRKEKKRKELRKIRLLSLLLILLASLAFGGGLAAYLSIHRSGTVTVVAVQGGIALSLDNVTWTVVGGSLSNVAVGSSLYARDETTGSGYAGSVTITWVLLQDGVEVYTLTDYTSATLSGLAGDVIYCSSDGSPASLFDWGSQITTSAIYEIEARFTKV